MGTVNQPQQPANTIRAGGVKATIWENQTKDGNSYFSITLTRSYKDSEGAWHETNTFYRDDLPKVDLVTRKAFEFIHLNTERQQTQTADKQSHAERIKAERANAKQAEKAA